ncbi:MAG: helix-turn-helix transcriptional regulator [Oscillospiraceae bacterium]|jgi:transcriptional regulator with XRE-family HTH domain|nr:helix-turn-helix transcriptional regulator [Oscillospiraceae bacterium]
MKIGIAENIKRLRREREMTQERLAEILDVSPQSVSRWELGACYPDMDMLPALANCFAVTVDELIGMERFRDEQRIADFQQRVTDMFQEQFARMSSNPNPIAITQLDETADADMAEFNERLYGMYRDIIREFPTHYELQIEYAARLTSDMRKTERLNDAIDVLDKVLANCTDSATRYTALSRRADVYGTLGDLDKLVAAAEELPHMSESCEGLLLRLLNNYASANYENGGLPDAQFERLRQFVPGFTGYLQESIRIVLQEKLRRGTLDRDETVAMLELREKLLPFSRFVPSTGAPEDNPDLDPETRAVIVRMIEDGDIAAQLHHCEDCARYLAPFDAERAIGYLERAVQYTLATHERQNDGTGAHFSVVDIGAIARMYAENPQFDPLRGDPRFDAAVGQLTVNN